MIVAYSQVWISQRCLGQVTNPSLCSDQKSNIVNIYYSSQCSLCWVQLLGAFSSCTTLNNLIKAILSMKEPNRGYGGRR